MPNGLKTLRKINSIRKLTNLSFCKAMLGANEQKLLLAGEDILTYLSETDSFVI